jgi:hypothetical protein
MIKVRLFSTVLLAALGLAARADERETSTVKFSDPSKPGTLRVAIGSGDVRVHGADTAEVVVTSELKPEGAAKRKDGLRVLSSSASYSLSEKDNVVSIAYGAGFGGNGNGDFDITVPRNTNLILSSSFGGDTVVSDVTGNIEVKNLNGEVKLENVDGGALVETMNGQVDVSVRALHEGKPLSFTSMNGEVTVALPASAKASVRLRSHNGAILTDFDEKALVTRTQSLGGKNLRVADGVDVDEIRTTVREAVRTGIAAARAAADGAREAARAARESAQDADNDEGADVAPDAPMPVAIPVPPLPPMTGGKIVTGTLNGGGTEIRITTMNGDVKLRKIDDAK